MKYTCICCGTTHYISAKTIRDFHGITYKEVIKYWPLSLNYSYCGGITVPDRELLKIDSEEDQ